MLEIDQLITDGFCLTCRGCCRFSDRASAWAVHLSADEQRALGVQDTLLPVSGPNPDGTCTCAFLNIPANTCAIYYKRPFECRLYPFLINRRGTDVFLALDMNCPYAKNRYETQRMRDYIAYLADVCNAPEFIRLLRENPWLIQRYPDVLNVAPISI